MSRKWNSEPPAARTCATHNPGDLACGPSCPGYLHPHPSVGPASVAEMLEADEDAAENSTGNTQSSSPAPAENSAPSDEDLGAALEMARGALHGTGASEDAITQYARDLLAVTPARIK